MNENDPTMLRVARHFWKQVRLACKPEGIDEHSDIYWCNPITQEYLVNGSLVGANEIDYELRAWLGINNQGSISWDRSTFIKFRVRKDGATFRATYGRFHADIRITDVEEIDVSMEQAQALYDHAAEDLAARLTKLLKQ